MQTIKRELNQNTYPSTAFVNYSHLILQIILLTSLNLAINYAKNMLNSSYLLTFMVTILVYNCHNNVILYLFTFLVCVDLRFFASPST